MNRISQATEIAQAVVFLCSDAASYITGQPLASDAGVQAWRSLTNGSERRSFSRVGIETKRPRSCPPWALPTRTALGYRMVSE